MDTETHPHPPTPSLKLDLAFRLDVEVDTPTSFGPGENGERRLVPILGGQVSGRVEGRICPGGVDDQTIAPDGLTRLAARYVIQTSNGLIHVTNRGLRRGSPDAIRRLNRGEEVDPSEIYFRCTPCFYTTAPEHLWLMRSVFIGSGIRRAKSLALDIYEVA